MLFARSELVVQALQERVVGSQCFEALVAHRFQQQPGVGRRVPQLLVHASPQLVGAVIPAPAQVKREHFEALKRVRQWSREIMAVVHRVSVSDGAAPGDGHRASVFGYVVRCGRFVESSEPATLAVHEHRAVRISPGAWCDRNVARSHLRYGLVPSVSKRRGVDKWARHQVEVPIARCAEWVQIEKLTPGCSNEPLDERMRERHAWVHLNLCNFEDPPAIFEFLRIKPELDLTDSGFDRREFERLSSNSALPVRIRSAMQGRWQRLAALAAELPGWKHITLSQAANETTFALAIGGYLKVAGRRSRRGNCLLNCLGRLTNIITRYDASNPYTSNSR